MDKQLIIFIKKFLKITMIKKMKNKIKAIGYILFINFLFSLIAVILAFLLGKLFGFEGNRLTPGSSTVGHPLVTSYKDGLLLYWQRFLFFFICIFFLSLLLATSFYKDLKEKLDRKDEEKKKSKENDSLNKNKPLV